MSALYEDTSVHDEDAPIAAASENESLQDWAARRRREMHDAPEKAIVIPLPGYEDRLSVQFRALNYREALAIENRQEKNKDQAEALLFVAADKLIAACERIVEATPYPNTYNDTGYKLNAKGAREFFGCAIPDGAGGRVGVLAILPDEEAVVRYAGELEERRQALRAGTERGMAGESEASATTPRSL
jgi:hypothetical protein